MSIASRLNEAAPDEETRRTLAEVNILELMTREIITGDDDATRAKSLAELLLMLRGGFGAVASTHLEPAQETIDATLELIYLRTYEYDQAFEAWCDLLSGATANDQRQTASTIQPDATTPLPAIPADKLEAFREVLLALLSYSEESDEVSKRAYDLLLEALDDLANDLMPLTTKDSILRIVKALGQKGGKS